MTNPKLLRCASSLLVVLATFVGCKCARTGGDAPPSKESPAAMKIDPPADLDVPRSNASGAAPNEGIPIYVSRSKIVAGVDRREVALLGDPQTLAAIGVDPRYKGSDLSAIEALRTAIDGIRKDKQLGEWVPAAIVADASTPFHVVGEVIVTVQQAKFEHYDLVVKHDDGSFAAVVLGKTRPPDAPPPKASEDGGVPPTANVYLGVRLTPEGFSLRAFNREIGAECALGNPQPTVPKTNGAYDFAQLTACAAKQKARAPQTHDDFVMITGAPAVPYGDVVRTIDALRTSADGATLFPQVALSVVH